MFGELAVLYLFLGGAGAGCIAVASILDLAVVREPFGGAGYLPGPAADPLGRTVSIAFLVGFVAIVAGVSCLAFDLGRIDRIAALFANPSPTLLTFGSYALTALVAIGAGLALVRFAYLPAIPRAAVVAAEIVAVVVGAAVMLYTGLLLATVGGVRFWATPFVPALFFLSSASSGIACVVLAGVGESADAPMRATMRRLAICDAVVIVAEAACAAGLLAQAAGSDHPGVEASYALLATGELAPAWWAGFALCGLAVPIVAETAYLAASRSRDSAGFGGTARVVLLVAAAFALAGALSLRVAIAGAGVHRDLELGPTMEPGAVAVEQAVDVGVAEGIAGESEVRFQGNGAII